MPVLPCPRYSRRPQAATRPSLRLALPPQRSREIPACKFRATYRKTCAAVSAPGSYALANLPPNSVMNEKIHLTSLHFELSPATQDQIRQDLDQILCQGAGVVRVDASFEGEYHDNTRIIYRVTLRAQLRDEVMFELKQGEKLLPTISATARSLAQRLTTKTPATASA